MNWNKGGCSQRAGALTYLYGGEITTSVPVFGHLTGYDGEQPSF